MNKLNPIKYIENMISHHPKSISLWMTEGIVINGERYIIKEFRLRDGSLYAVIAENKYTPKYFEVKLAPDEETLKDIYQAIKDNKIAIEQEITDRKNEINRVDSAIKANTAKIDQEITDRKNEINRVDKKVEANTAKINQEITDRQNDISRVNEAISANTAKINKEITDRQNEISRVDGKIEANTAKINKEITDRQHEISRVDNAIAANTEKINQEIADRTDEINRVNESIESNTAKINQEITDRRNEISRVDDAIKANTTKINQEIADRKSDIGVVNGLISANTSKINKEVNDRQSEISRVENKIAEVQGSIKPIVSGDTGLLTVTNEDSQIKLTSQHDTQKEQVLESRQNTLTITKGRNGTSETTKVDTNPQKVLLHENLATDYGISKNTTGNTTKLGLEYTRVQDGYDLNNLLNGCVRAGKFVNAPNANTWYFVSAFTENMYTIQEAVTLVDTKNTTYRRTKQNGVWGAWREQAGDISVVGGRNYLRGTSKEYQTYTNTDYILGYPSTDRNWNELLDPLRGKTVTLRSYIKNDTDFPVRIQMWFTAGGIFGNSVAPHSEGWSVGTGKVSSDWTSANVAFTQTGDGANNGGTIKAKEAKLEIGNIPSDWSPAPEDYDSKLAIVEGKIPTSIGVRNLLAKTNQGKTNWRWSISSGGWTGEDYNVGGITGVKLTRTTDDSVTWSFIQYQGLLRNLIEPNTKYTLSFDVKPSVDVTFTVSLMRGDGSDPITNATNMNKALANQWTKVSCVLTSNNTLSDKTDQVVYMQGMPTANGNWLIIKNIKLEKGVVTSDWSPAPEDYDAAIKANTTKINQEITDRKNEINRVEGKIPTEIGTVNLIKQSTAQKGLRLSSESGTFSDEKHMLTDWIKIKPSTVYTLTTYEDVDETDMWYSMAWYSTNNADYSGWIDRPTGAAPAADLKGGRQYASPANAAYAKVSYPINYPKVKFERGKIATDYSPNPEDYDSKLSTMKSEIKQTTDSIKASVSSVQTAASNAQSTANTAVTKADTAQSTANTNKQTISTLNSSLAQKQDKLTAGTGIVIQGNVISATGSSTPQHDTQKEQVLESRQNTITITKGANGTSETTKVDTNPQKVLLHENLLTDYGISKTTTGNTTKLGLEYTKVENNFDLNTLVNGRVRGGNLANAPASNTWFFVSSFTEYQTTIQDAITLTASDNKTYRRLKNGNVWGAWREQVGDKSVVDNLLRSEIARVENELPSGEMNLVEYGRPADGYSPYNYAEYAAHPFYYNGAYKMYIIKNTATSEKTFGMNRFKVERNTDYTLYFKGFNNGAITNMDVWFLKRVSGSAKDYDYAHPLVSGRKLSVGYAEEVIVTFNTGNYDEGYIRFDNNGSTTAGTQADLYFGDVSVKKGKSNSGWSPSLAELASSQDLKSAKTELTNKITSVENRLITNLDSLNSMPGTLNAVKLTPGSITGDMVTGGRLRSTNGSTVIDLTSGIIIFNGSSSYIQHADKDKIFEIQTLSINGSTGVRESMTSSFGVRKSSSTIRSGVKFSLYTPVVNKPTAQVDITSDSLNLSNSQNTLLLSVNDRNTYTGNLDIYSWGDIPVANLYGGLIAKDVGISGHTESLKKIIEKLCAKTGITWL